jgi:hypothetical protein
MTARDEGPSGEEVWFGGTDWEWTVVAHERIGLPEKHVVSVQFMMRPRRSVYERHPLPRPIKPIRVSLR